ncbi:MAG: SMP-30/gluconolactonase/LRE family protein [Anaerolineae bacterium]|nr:SMP-30/gluconolactonase/LRE family protein [Anaerolineae bacterium]
MIFASQLSRPEGPVLLPDGSWAVVEMGADRGCVTRISADGRSRRVIARTGRPNGLALDRHGVLWVAESADPALIRLTLDGETTLVATACEGEPFLFPNDLAFGPDGALYMTDSGILIDEWEPGGVLRDDYRELAIDGRVFRIDTNSGQVTKLDGGIRFANGLAFGRDGDLYVAETVTGWLYRYPWRDGHVSGPRQRFANVIDPQAPPGFKGPDGLKFAANGELYVAVVGQGDVTVLSPHGEVVRRLRTGGGFPTNLAFGPAGSGRLYVTEIEQGVLEVHDVGVDGVPPCR